MNPNQDREVLYRVWAIVAGLGHQLTPMDSVDERAKTRAEARRAWEAWLRVRAELGLEPEGMALHDEWD